MERLQTLNGDTVMETTETRVVKVRVSERDLLRRRESLEQAIAKFTGELAVVNEQLQTLYEARDRRK